MTDWIAELCAAAGVTSDYRGFEGQQIKVARDTQRAVLAALGLPVEGDGDARAALEQIQTKAAQRPLPPEVIVTAGVSSTLTLAHPAAWALEAEGSLTVLASGEARQAIDLPELPLGIHRLRLQVGSADYTTWVLARPDRAFGLADCVDPPRIWGVLAALYGLTNGQKAALGSYAALGEYAVAMAAHGADLVGINPIHAMGEARPGDVISPYSPSHRGFLNTWHTTSAPAGQASELIDYPSALRAHAAAQQAGFEAFRALPPEAADRQACAAFLAQAGAPLQTFGVFEALALRFGPDWRDWPQAYRDPASQAVADFAAAHQDQISRTLWAQWRADQQLATAQARATGAGMRVGLYLDLAVGPRLGGAETWGTETSLVVGATLGAPPDPLGPLGQSWGLAPQSPFRLRAQGYAGFARLLRAVMRHAGMIRIDHVLGLMRSFWIPEGGREGTYVSYPLDALLAVVAIESRRNRTVVVGEDLGLVPAGLRDKLLASGIYGLDVLQYMRTEDGGFADPSSTRRTAVCTFATHDTPTLAGFFAAEDARVRAGFGGIDRATLAEISADRHKAANTLATKEPVSEIHARLARSRSEIVAVQLDDVAERVDQQNLPGTVDEYPNWRLHAPFSVSDIAGSAQFARLGAEMARHGRTNRNGMEKDNDRSDCAHLAD